MSWVNENRNIIRATALPLFLLAILGPWMYDLIYVPAEYTCGKPFIRLDGDYCGAPMSGFQFFSWFAGGFFIILMELIAGTFTGGAREFLAALSLLPLFPFFSTLFLLWKKDSHRLQTTNLTAWGLAGVLTLMVFMFQASQQVFRLWGLWLYIGLAICAVIVEIILWKDKSKPVSKAL